jgi:hypothetical protein
MSLTSPRRWAAPACLMSGWRRQRALGRERADVDGIARPVKVKPAPEGPRRYSPAECIGSYKQRIEGDPDPNQVSTSFAERSNLNVQMHTRRFTRLTNAFSKKVENHAHSVALFAMNYNFVRIDKTLRTTPAMAANVTKRLWEIGDIVDVLEAWENTTWRRRGC